ncbi:MAG: divergent polysaccharide deacetylase family protein, partial [Tabrizicola sp.]
GTVAEAADVAAPAPVAPDVALAETVLAAPEAPGADDAAPVADPAGPPAAEVMAPQTAVAPDRPAETLADAAATPDVAPPAPPAAAEAEATLLADAGPDAAAAPGSVTPADTAIAEPAAPAGAPEAATGADPAPAPAADAQPAAEQPVAPAEDSAPEPSPEAALPPEAPPAAEPPEAGTGGAPAMDVPPEAAAEDPAPRLPGVQPEAMPGKPETPDAAVGEGNGSTFVPAPRLVRRGEGVIIGRATEEATPEAAGDPEAAGTAVPEDPRPIARFAATFENPSGKPPLAIVLIDDGAADLDRAGLAALPFPVSFALDPLDPATPERAAIYRAAGREVVMLVTGIAPGARASDVEVAFQSMEQGLPEAVAAMELAEPTFQSNRALAGAVVPILKAGGRGLLTREGGLNAADQLARREDVEASVVFRDLDTAGADRAALRRLMDRAVFKAGQDGRVTVVGTASSELAAALLEWTVEGRSATVALAPVTAVLKVD